MFERFTETAIKTIMLAQQESRRLGHNFVGTEMILLGLIGTGDKTAAVLKAHGLDLKHVRIHAEKIIGRGNGVLAIEIPFTPRSKRLLELSWEAARDLGHKHIGTAHLGLGMLRQHDGVAKTLIEILAVDAQALERDILAIVAGVSQPMPDEPVVPEDTSDFENGPLGWYSPNSIKCIQRAWGVAQTFGNDRIAVEHLFLGLLECSDKFCAVLQTNEVDLSNLRRNILADSSPGNTAPLTSIPFDDSTKTVFKQAWVTAREFKSNQLSEECLCLALIDLKVAALAKALDSGTGKIDAVRTALVEAIKEQAAKTVHTHPLPSSPYGKSIPLGWVALFLLLLLLGFLRIFFH